EVRLDIEVGELAERVPSGPVVRLEQLARVEAPQLGEELRRVQRPRLLGVRERLKVGVVPLHRGEAEVAEGAPAPPARGVEALEERESPPAPVERQHVHEAMAKDRFVPPVSGEQLIAAVARE